MTDAKNQGNNKQNANYGNQNSKTVLEIPILPTFSANSNSEAVNKAANKILVGNISTYKTSTTARY